MSDPVKNYFMAAARIQELVHVGAALNDDQSERALAEIEFQETAWDGCQHLDCIPGCSHNPESWRCERFERAFAEWIKR